MSAKATGHMAAAMLLSCGMAMSARAAQEQAPASQPAEPKASDPAPTAGEASATPIRFSFENAPYSEVLGFFSRESGVPIIYQASVPEQGMTFVSGEAYSFDTALDILNRFLLPHKARLTQQDEYLYFRSLGDAARQPGEIYQGELPGQVRDGEIVTLAVPLTNIDAADVAEQLKGMVAEYGSIVPVASQNLLVLTETGEQIRRIREVVRLVDSQPPSDSDYRVYPLRSSQVNEVIGTLRSLVPEYEKTIVKQGNRHDVIDDVSQPPVRFEPNERSNSIIAIGPTRRLETAAQLIEMLDGGEGGVADGRRMASFVLETVTPQEAARQLDRLFSSVPGERRPTIIPMETQGKITVVGSASLVMQAEALLGELDPGLNDRADEANQTTVVELERMDAATLERTADRLLSPRQRQVLRFAPLAGGRSLIVTGPAADVRAFESLAETLDSGEGVTRDVRTLTVGRGDPQAVVDRAMELYALTGMDEREPVRVDVDAARRTVTVVGQRGGLDKFVEFMRQSESGVVVERESRTYTMSSTRPSQVAQRAERVAEAMLRPSDGTAYDAPQFEAVDELNQLIVRAGEGQFSVIEAVVAQLDKPAGQSRFVTVPVRNATPQQLLDRVQPVYETEAARREDPSLNDVSLTPDAAAGAIIAQGSASAVALFQEVLQQVQQLVPPARTTKMLDLEFASAEQVLPTLQGLIEGREPVDPSREAPAPQISVLERTNTLVVKAEPAQHAMVAELVARLDTPEPMDLPPLKLLQLRTANAGNIARMLSDQYRQRPQADRIARPVDVRADEATNTLIVSAHEELLADIKSFVDEINEESQQGPERAPLLFRLSVAKATDVADAMNRLYPEPAIPRDRRGQPMPWLQQPREVVVSADESSNSLIIDAPVEMHESLRELASQLDQVEVPPSAELRTYRVVNADVETIKRVLEGMERQGNLSAPAQAGRQSVRVTIEAEPRSGTLIVAGDEVTFERVEAMLEDLSAVPVERETAIVPIANADAQDVGDRALSIYRAQVAGVPGAGEVELSINESTNALEIVADAQAMERFLGVIDLLQDQAGPPREARLIQLQQARASDVIEFLRDLVGSSNSLRQQGGPEPVFEAIESTNAILAAAVPSQFGIIEQLVADLDRQQSAGRQPLRILRLRTTEAGNIAEMLQESYQRRTPEERARQPVDIRADAATNTLLVSAHPEMMPEIESVVSQLNEARTIDDEDREIRIFPLQHARAEELAQTIDEMYPEPPMPRDSRGRPRPDLQQPKEVVVRANRTTNALIVDAPSRRLAGFEQIVNSLDRSELAGDVVVRTYQPQRAEPEAIASAIRDLAGSGALGGSPRTPLTVSVEPNTRTLIVSGPGEVFVQVEALLEDLDGSPARPESTVKLYKLQHARADRLEPLLRDLLTTRLREQQQVSGGLGVSDVASLLTVSAEPATNTLIISAPPVAQELAQSLVDALDTDEVGAAAPVVRVVPLSYGRSDQIAPQLERAIDAVVLPSGGEVRVSSVGGANALLLTGSQGDLELVGTLVDDLDTPPFDPEAVGVQTFELQHADAERVGPVIERLLEQQRESNPFILRELMRRDPTAAQVTPVRVEVDSGTNALLVSGPSKMVELAQELIERLDRPSAESGRTLLTFTPARAQPQALVDAVSSVAEQTIERDRQGLEISADPNTGTVLVVGGEAAAVQAVELLQRFDDRAPATPVADVTVITLANASAANVAQTVESLLNDRGRWPAELVRAERAGLDVPRPTLRADVASNRIVMSVPSAMMPMAGKLIEAMDAAPDGQGERGVRLVRLTQGDADSVAAAVQDALRAGLRPGQPQPTVRAETGSNSIVISASQSQIEEAVELINQMDVQVEPEAVGVLTLRLKHTRAETVAPILETILQQESVVDLLPWWAVSDFAARNPDQAVKPAIRVIPEPGSNTVVVAAPRPMLELAEQVVAELDSAEAAGDTDRRVVRLIPLRNADAAEVSQNLAGVLSDEGGVEPPTIKVDQGSNTLIVRATESQMAEIEGLAQQIDSATLSGSRQMRLIPIDRSRGDAAVVAQTLRQLLEQQGGVRVEVIGVDELMKEAGKPIGPGSALPARRDPLHEAVMSAVLAGVQQEQGESEPQSQRQPESQAEAEVQADGVEVEDQGALDRGPTITIAVDPATNTLVVVGSPRVTDRLASLAEQIQQQMPREATRTRVIRLPSSADANAIAQIVRQTVQRVGRASTENPSGFTGRPDVVPDPIGSSLIVWANDTDFEVLGELIAAVSRLEASESLTLKIYPLVNIDADDAADSINDLVSAQPTGQQARRFRRQQTPARASDLTLLGPDGQRIEASIDPDTVRVLADPSGTRLVVTAPSDVLPLIDSFVSLIDQSPLADRLAIRRYELDNAEAQQLSGAFADLFRAQRRGPGGNSIPEPSFVADDRTNALLVTASSDQHQEIERLLIDADAPSQDDGLELAILPLQNAAPRTVAQVINQVLIGNDPGRRDAMSVSADDDAGMLVVRAEPELLAEVRELAEQLDSASVEGAPIRTIKLETADAPTVAQAIQSFMRDRAQAAGRGRRGQTRVNVVGERRSGTLIVAASDEDFAQVEELAAALDMPAAARDLRVQIVRVQNGRAQDLNEAVSDLQVQLYDERVWGNRRGNDAPPEDKLYTSVHEPSNSIIVVGQGDTMDLMLGLISDLDQERSDVTRKIVQTVPIKDGDPDAIAQIIRQAFQETDRGRWWMTSQAAVNVTVDRARGLLIMVGEKPKVDQAVEYAQVLASTPGIEDRPIEVIELRHANADRVQRTLQQFFAQRSSARGQRQSDVTIIGSPDGNVLITTASEDDMSLLQDMVAQIDQPDLPQGRSIEVFSLRSMEPREASEAIRSMIPSAGREDAIRVTPQPSRNAIIVSAQDEQFPLIRALLEKIDTDAALPFVSVQLSEARATQVAQDLRSALPDGMNVELTAVDRTNTVIISGGNEESVAWVREQIAQFDVASAPPATEFRRVQLEHARAVDVWLTLREVIRAQPRERGAAVPGVDYVDSQNVVTLTAAPDEMRQLLQIIDELDVKTGGERQTQFVKLRFAEANLVAEALKLFYGPRAIEAKDQGARDVSILSDAVTNTLIIAAGEEQWEGIRSLLDQFDTEAYSTGRQLKVIPLNNADARNVADALNEGFRAPLEQQIQREQARRQGNQQGDRRQVSPDLPTVLIDPGETPVVSAEVETNSLIVFANVQDLERIETIAKSLDGEGAGRLPDARVIALESGRASRIAQAVQRIFIDPLGRRGPRTPVVYGDDASNMVVFRGSEAEFTQVRALVQTLETEGSSADVRVRTLMVKGIPAVRMRETLLNAFRVRAQQLNEGLGIEVDRDSNALVIAASERLFEEMKKVVDTLQGELAGDQDGAEGLDPAGPMGLGQSIRIIELASHLPQQMVQIANQLGLTRPMQADRPGVVSEPINIISLPTRNAVAVVAGAADADRVEQLVRAIDQGGIEGAQSISLVRLKTASADQVARVVREMLAPRAEQGQSATAQALAEQVRRRKMGAGESGPEFDLTVPVQLGVDNGSNSLLIASSAANVKAVEHLVSTLDTLPVGEAVVARIFPLSNADASRVQTIIDGLFREGEAIRRVPGTQRQGVPTTATGQALAGDVAIEVDARTNSLIVVGREDGVAFVEVLLADLDSEESVGWIEPTIITLEHADAGDVADLISETLVDGVAEAPQAAGLREQVGRLRLVQQGKDPLEADARLDSDLFGTLSGLTILPEPNSNRLIVVASPANLRIVRELVGMLDVESAAASNRVRFYALERASADRVADLLEDIFDDRRRAGVDREEDTVIVRPDLRTNTLVVSTSQRSFAVLDDLVDRLDREEADQTVGLHTIDVAGADVEQLAPRIERLMRDRIEAATRGGQAESAQDVFSIEPSRSTNQLLVVSSNENLEVVRGLIESLSQEGQRQSEGQEFALIGLERGTASRIAESIQTLYVQPELDKRGDNAVSVVAENRSNSIVVSGTTDDIARVRDLVQKLDVAEVVRRTYLQRVELESADAREVVQLLQNLLSGQSVGGSAGESASIIEFRRQIRDEMGNGNGQYAITSAAIDDSVRSQIAIEADERTNAVTIISPPEVMDLILGFIDEVDRSEVDDRILKYFRLQNADAEQMAVVLQELFSLQRQGDQLILVPSRRRPIEDDQPFEQQLTPVSTERERLAITIDYRTNTIIVSATKEYVDLVSDVIERLDSIQATEREEVVYSLQNAQADQVQDVLQGYFQTQADRLRQLISDEGSESLSRVLDREVIVVGDPTSNKVIVSASPRYISTVNDIVSELDAAPPQVLVQALIAEVTLDENASWGLDFDLFDFGGDMYDFGMSAAGTGVATAVGLPNLSLTSADFGLAVRALEGQGRLEVLSRPVIQINNNESGNILVGDDIAIIESVDTFESGRTQANVTRRDVGISMLVRPSISSDGFVRLEIAPEISSLSSQQTQISENFAAPVINKREVQTTVTVRNGETVVIGGLIQSFNDNRNTSVPVFGDLPGVGWLFRTREKTNRRTELLVVLTPRIIPGGRVGVAEARRVTGSEMFRHTGASSKMIERSDVTGLSIEQFDPRYFPEEIMIEENTMGPHIEPYPTYPLDPQGLEERE
ncbi:MAG: secretin N-terminal domain-containing protein [Phycisphaerales bacterium JB060]